MTVSIRSPSRRAAWPRYTRSNMNARSRDMASPTSSPCTMSPARARIQRRLAEMPERRVAEVVPQTDRLHQVLVEPQRARDGARDLCDLQRVGEPRPVVVTLGRHEHLGLMLEPPERLGVHDPVPVALKRRAQ